MWDNDFDLTEQERETDDDGVIGLAVLLIAGKLIYSNSQNAFVNRAVRKACVSKGTLLNTYENGGRSYGTCEYEADGCQYRLDVEYSWDFTGKILRSTWGSTIKTAIRSRRVCGNGR